MSESLYNQDIDCFIVVEKLSAKISSLNVGMMISNTARLNVESIATL